MNIAEWFIRNGRTSAVLFVLLVLGGVQAFLSMPRLEDPAFTVRNALVITRFPGASPQRVEELVTDKLEEKLREIAEVKHIDSQSLSGISIITLEVDQRFKDMAPIWAKLRNKVDDVRPSLPEGVEAPEINDEFGDVFGVVVAITGDGHTYRELKDVADHVRDELLKVQDVAKVNLYGSQAERIFVEVANARLAEFGYSPYQLVQVLQAENAIQPGGRARVGPESVILEATGEFRTLDQLRRTVLRVPGRATAIALEDIATLRRDFVDPPTTLTRFDGAQALILAVNMGAGGNIVHMGAAVQARLDELERDEEVGIQFHSLVYQPKYVDRAIRDFTVNLLEAFVFVVAVVFIFTGLRTGAVVGALVPVAMLSSLLLMPLFEIELQQISIASLIIALGMLVDNGIVVSENVLVRLRGGEERLAAIKGAVKELYVPLLASSLTTIAAFLPIAIAKSNVGEYCFSLFVVVTLTLLSSWVLSLTFIPLLSFHLLKPAPAAISFEGRFYTAYRRVLLACLGRPWTFVAAVLAATVLGVAGMKLVPKSFFPPNHREMFTIDLWQPYGTDIRATAEVAARVEQLLLAEPDVVSVGTFVGSGGPRWYLSLSIEQDLPSYAYFIVNTRSIAAVGGIMDRLRARFDGEFPDSRYVLKRLEYGPPVGAPIQIRVAGASMPALYDLRQRVVDLLRSTPGLVNVRDDWGEWTKKMVVEVNQDRAKFAGLTSQDIALSLQTQISGMTATDFREGKNLIPIVVRSEQSYREDLGKIEGLNVYSYYTAQSVPLLQVAAPRIEWQPGTIRRRDQTRTMTIKADMLGRYASEALAELQPRLAELRASPDWPRGFTVEIGGENEKSKEANASIMAGMPVAMGLLTLILVFQFNSLRRPLIIVLTIPPMVVGIAAGLLLTKLPFGFMALLGVISLAGIIVNNAIIMLDRMEQERAQGQSWQDAIVVAAQRRLRPILMTATTTIIGLVPLALQGGPMWEPMAYVLIFGLGFATILTLALCPVLCSLFFRANFRDYRWDPAALARTSE